MQIGITNAGSTAIQLVDLFTGSLVWFFVRSSVATAQTLGEVAAARFTKIIGKFAARGPTYVRLKIEKVANILRNCQNPETSTFLPKTIAHIRR